MLNIHMAVIHPNPMTNALKLSSLPVCNGTPPQCLPMVNTTEQVGRVFGYLVKKEFRLFKCIS